MPMRIPSPAAVLRKTTFSCILSVVFILKLRMAPKRLISGENKESGENASVSEPQPSISGFTGITSRETLQRCFHGW
ncbi:hypothetical protein E2C01_041526 [Portunus trituberculatus]|uniref:Uncharacterized protein n=1 Tax=Portunus trituberculatus TaxID=210409 RepID=A0A5B7FS43_PORTR|nr:hypothetical protein [Portunus trituberculatus]